MARWCEREACTYDSRPRASRHVWSLDEKPSQLDQTWDFSKSCRKWKKRRHGLAINRAVSLALFATRIICIGLLILLFPSPETLQIRSLQSVTDDGTINPSVPNIALLTILLGGALSPLLTIAVELQLAGREACEPLSTDRVHTT